MNGGKYSCDRIIARGRDSRSPIGEGTMNSFGVLLFLLSAITMTVAASATASEAAADEWSHHRHHLAAILGVTSKTGMQAGTYGIEYTYRVGEPVAVGGWYEQSTGSFELDSVGVFTNIFVAAHLPVMVGIGAERELFGSTKYLARIGAQYQFHPGKVTVSPAGWVDLIQSGKQLYFLGATVGFGF
jgi:hypothetical protein